MLRYTPLDRFFPFHRMSTPTARRSILHSAWGAILWPLLFLAAFLVFYYTQKPSTLIINNPKVAMIFSRYGVAIGPILALLGMLLIAILAGIKRILGLKRFRIVNPIIVLIVAGASLGLGWQLAFREKPYIDITRGIIGTLAMPILLTSAVTVVLAIVWFLWTLIRR